MKARHEDVLKNFVDFCNKHPDLRFWQALSSWSNSEIFLRSYENNTLIDTFYFEKADR